MSWILVGASLQDASWGWRMLVGFAALVATMGLFQFVDENKPFEGAKQASGKRVLPGDVDA